MSTFAATFQAGVLERRFRFGEHGTTLARDTMAGVTTFIVMSYIIFVNPTVLSLRGTGAKGLPFEAVLTSTCLVAGVMTILMGVYTNRAYALAPGLGLNAVVAFGLVLGAGYSFPEAMGLIVLEGAAVTLLVLSGIREQIMRAVPLELRVKPRVADRGRPHVDAAAPGAEIERSADDCDIQGRATLRNRRAR